MRFLADENFPGAAVTALAAAGHDVVWVRTAAPGAADPDVLAWAAREARILLTFDNTGGDRENGDRAAIRTRDPRFRKPVLYPTELRGRTRGV